eukprot:3918924-Amphidinium_carterae.2
MEHDFPLALQALTPTMTVKPHVYTTQKTGQLTSVTASPSEMRVFSSDSMTSCTDSAATFHHSFRLVPWQAQPNAIIILGHKGRWRRAISAEDAFYFGKEQHILFQPTRNTRNITQTTRNGR